ncbi:hypothetical protein HRR83_007393 [Exophiala dermatitidis]|nr:hypothetical protein HRR75_006277 [Exophiala dermatitidis]KAJ4510367.1 hypothetical protein HRR74_006839 [Exophiala dermatitidis]KAJ4510698.1 hypothetical protein HRR73_006770 [Exophiala dermatitidis]KAJ4536044.1 hypothetical protein HRR77_007490 [Exophiala dermatitidis]KAJ4545566.1 hypothetical protein HRR78_006288 [Exophiala dermatitidis]
MALRPRTHPPPDKEGYKVVYEFGREYGVYRRGQYMFPHDEREKIRLDMMNTMFKVLRPGGNHRLFNAPVPGLEPEGKSSNRKKLPLRVAPRILDLGCGTGIWMNEMAVEFPYAEFVGVDIHYMASKCHPENVSVRVPWDYESPWAMGERSWDLIHMQMGLGSVSDWPGLYRKVLKHLVPGYGWFEHVELDFEPRCDDGSLRPGKLTEWWHMYLKNFYASINRRLHYDPDTGELLLAAGFKDIHHAVYRIPLNPWSDDRGEHRAALWWGQVMSRGLEEDGGNGFEALSLAPLCRYNGWAQDHVERLCEEALDQACDPDCRVYNELHIWWARSPHKGEV